jgi:hypothetical protein
VQPSQALAPPNDLEEATGDLLPGPRQSLLRGFVIFFTGLKGEEGPIPPRDRSSSVSAASGKSIEWSNWLAVTWFLCSYNPTGRAVFNITKQFKYPANGNSATSLTHAKEVGSYTNRDPCHTGDRKLKGVAQSTSSPPGYSFSPSRRRRSWGAFKP